MRKLLVLLLSVTMLFTAQYTHAETNVGGIITTDTTWTMANSPYILTENILVNEGVTLNIEAGVIVKLNLEKSIQLNGELIAQGTINNKIIFTSNQVSPATGDWGYIIFANTSTDATYDEEGSYTDGSILEYCVIEYAGAGDPGDIGSVNIDNAYPFINHCTIQKNSASGIRAYNYPSEGEIRIYNCTFSNNASPEEGGGISLNYTKFLILNTTVRDNTSNTFGGGIFIYKGSGTIHNCDVSSNVITGGFAGGGIRATADGEITIVNNTIGNNIAGDGGGISFSAASQSHGTITHNHIHNNIATNSGAGNGGGGISIGSTNSQTTVSTNLIEGNEAENGSAIRAGGSANDEFKYNSIINNTESASSSSSAIYVYNPQSTFNYNNIYNNTTTYELFNNDDSTSPNLNAQYNYWGTTDDSEIQAKIYDWFDDGLKSIVQYQPIATESYELGSDSDNDGLPDGEEQGPDGNDPNYDGNDDYIADSFQNNVASFHTYDNQGYVTLESPIGTSISNCKAVDNPSSTNAPSDVEFSYGFFEFTITGMGNGGVTSVILHFPVGTTFNTYYKYGPTPSNAIDHWYEFLYNGQTGAEINGNAITLHFVDGNKGDDDLTADGTVIDVGGPGVSVSTGGGGGGCFIATAAR